MKSGKKLLLGLMGGLALAATVKAVVNDSPATGSADATSGDPYEAIWLRNVFDLKPVFVETNPAPVAALPPPNVHLTGITTIFGTKQALFMIQDPPPPGKPAERERSMIMKEGERRDKLEVLEIDAKARKVKIKLEDVVSTITFETNRVSANPAGVPNPQFIPPGAPNPNFAPRPMPNGFNNPAFQNRNLNNNYQQPSPVGNPGGLSPGGGTPVANNQTMSSEEATALFLIHNTAHQAEINAGTYPPPPPIAGLNNNPNQNQNGQGNPGQNFPTLPTIPTAPRGSRGTGTLQGGPPPIPGQ